MHISRNSFTLLAGAAASALILSACGGGSSSTPAALTTQPALTATAASSNVAASGTTTLNSSGGAGTGAVSYAVASGSCTVSGTTLTAPSTSSTCTVTATKAADATYLAITSPAISVKVYAGTALVTVNQQAIVGSGTAANYGNYANDYTGNGANGWLTDGGATANFYKDDTAGITWNGWYFGQSSPGDHPNYVAVLGLQYSGTAPWGMGYFVKAPSNGNARMLGYQNINLEFWSPAANVGTNANVSIFLNAPAITHNGSSCVPSLKGMATIPTAAGTLTTIALSSLTLDKACGYASGTEVLQAGINEIHLQLLSANNSLNIAGAQGGGAANSLNVGRILFN